MAITKDYVFNGKTYPNAYINIRPMNLNKEGDDWKFDMIVNVKTEEKDLTIETIHKYKKIPHTPGVCIHQEGYAHLKSLPKFAGAIDEL